MPTTVAIDDVTTADAAPTVAPHRISARPGRNVATVRFTPAASDASAIRAYRVRVGGVDPHTGRLVGGAGRLCGEGVAGPNPVQRCDVPSGQQLVETITADELAGLENTDVTVKLYALSLTQGWS